MGHITINNYYKATQSPKKGKIFFPGISVNCLSPILSASWFLTLKYFSKFICIHCMSDSDCDGNTRLTMTW